MRPPDQRHLRRVDNEDKSTHAWVVSLQRNKRITIKMFSDSVWGGNDKALAAARQWRDQQTQPADEYAHEIWRRNRLRTNNSSGLVGIGRYERPLRPDGKPGGDAFWLASWIDENGRQRKRKYSVKRWGEEAARQRAIEEREREVSRSVAARTALDAV
jgi:hypothetical protein